MAALPNPTSDNGGIIAVPYNLEARISPKLRKRSKIDEGLKLVLADPRFKFPEPFQDQAKLLYERWEDTNRGAVEVSDDEVEEVPPSPTTTSEPPAKRRKSTLVPLSEIGIAKAPPKPHPIYGVNGMMHGVCIMQGKARKDSILDNHYPKRNAKFYGHNGLSVGQWFAFQIIALFHGVHGVNMGGIAGNSQTGAYSIVVSGALDKDKGDTIYYSGSNSHSKTNPTTLAPSTAATQSLHASQITGKTVRVLRAAAGHSRYAPLVSIRYDGLYRVVDMQLQTNEKGGRYEHFVLKRLEGQESLDSITKRSPTKQQKADHNYIHSGY